jgi:hypothetical protein
MMRKITLALLTIALSANLNCYATNTQIDKPIELERLNDIQDAKAFGQTLEALNSKIRACVNQGLAKQQECECLYPKEYSDTKTAFDKTLTLHPNWRNQVIVIRKNEKPNSFYHVSFRALNRAFGEQNLNQKCPTHPSSGTR